jgi:glutaredoxin 3
LPKIRLKCYSTLMKNFLSFLLFFSSFTAFEGCSAPKTYKVTLYYSPQCPYSQKVLTYLKKSKIDIPLKNVKLDNPARDELLEQGGYLIVPCLIVDGQAIYDANDIIDWLSAHQEDLSKSKTKLS